MAKLPDLETIPVQPAQASREQQPSYQPGAVQRAAQDVGLASARFGQQAGEAVAKGAEGILEVQDRLNYASGITSVLNEESKAKQDALTDPDYTTMPDRYRKRMQDAIAAAGTNIIGADRRAEFQASTAHVLMRSLDTVTAHAHTKEVDAKRQWLDAYVDSNIDGALRDPTNDEMYLKASHDAIDAMAARGDIINRQEAAKLRKDTAEKYAIRRAALLPPDEQLRALAPSVAAPTATAEGGAPSTTGALDSEIQKSAERQGVSATTLRKIAQVETGGQATTNPRSGAAGPFQFMPDTAKQYGITDPNDPAQSADAAARLLKDNTSALRSSLGREPTVGEQYLAHQQGASGAAALLKDPDRLAVDVLADVYGDIRKAKAAVVSNGGTVGMKAGEFAKMWAAKVDNAPIPARTGTVATGERTFAPTNDWRDYIPPEKRVELLRVAEQRLETGLNRQVAAQRYIEGASERFLKESQRANDASMLADASDGKDIDPHRLSDMLRTQQMSEGGFKAVQAELRRQGKADDNPLVIADLQARARAGEDVSDDVNKAVELGDIKGTTGIGIIKAFTARQQKGKDQIERASFATLRTVAGGDAVEKGMLDFGNTAHVAQMQLWSQAQDEWNRRVLVKGEDPQAVLGDMTPRFGHPINDVRALPRPRLGSVGSLSDVGAVWQKTKDAREAGQISADQFDAEARLLQNYKRLIEQDEQRKTAAAAVPAAGGAKPRVLGLQPGKE